MLNFYSANYTSTETPSTKKIFTRAMARRKKSLKSYPQKDKSGQVLKTEHNLRLALDTLPKGHSQSFVRLLYNFARRGKVCFMSRETIAREICTSPKYITQLSNKLVKSGLVHKIDRGTTHQTNIYSLNLDSLLMRLDVLFPKQTKKKNEMLPNSMAELISLGHIKGDELATPCTNPLASPCTNPLATPCPKDWPHLRTKNKEIYINTSPTSPMAASPWQEPKRPGEGFTQNFINQVNLPPCDDFVPETPQESILCYPGYEGIPQGRKADKKPISDRSKESLKELADCRKVFGESLKILGHSYDEGEEVRFYREAFKKGKEGINPLELAKEFEKCATVIKNDPELRVQTKTIFRLFEYESIFSLAKHKAYEATKEKAIKFYERFQKTVNRDILLKAYMMDNKCTIKQALEFLRIGEKAKNELNAP